MEITGLYFIYGLCVMFYFMMAWFFGRKGNDRLSRLVMLLMIVIGVECVKDLFFINSSLYSGRLMWSIITAIDMVVVPLYAFVLIELCRPGWLTRKRMILHETPFLVLPILLVIFENEVFYDIEVGWAAIYGFGYATWTLVAIPHYHRHLKEVFSYDENINLKWLRIILLSFFVILGLWILDCLVIDLNIESVYMLGSLVIWMFICYFIYRHESVIDELRENPGVQSGEEEEADAIAGLNGKMRKLFIEDMIFLNPRLKLSDVADMAGTNRTYVSQFFNRNNGASFFDYVNKQRVEYVCELLKSSSENIETIALKSGFNSIATFHRVFSKFCGCTPAKYRSSNT